MEWMTNYSSFDQLEKMKSANITTILVGPKSVSTRMPVRCDWDEIRKIKEKCDELQLQMGMMINRIFFDEDLETIQEALEFAKELKVSRIDYTDPAVFIEAEKKGLKEILNYNPDTLMCNDRDVSLYQSLGIQGVVLSKEITLEEMVEIAEKSKSNLEAIVLGRLSMSYSKRPLLTDYLKEINSEEDIFDRRDLCLVETTRTGKMPIVEDEFGTTIYTDYTLGAFNEIEALKKAGITRFRFENGFISEEAFYACLEGFNKVEEGQEGEKIFKSIQEAYPELNLSTGYMYQKTNLVK